MGFGLLMIDLGCGDVAWSMILSAASIPILGAVLFFTTPRKKDAPEISN